MSRKFSWTFKKHFVVSMILSGISYIVDLLMNHGYGTAILQSFLSGRSLIMDSQAASIGIIGGADGPTSIFIAGSPLAILSFSNVVFWIVLLLLYKPIKQMVENASCS
jgi:hypothetical protein